MAAFLKILKVTLFENKSLETAKTGQMTLSKRISFWSVNGYEHTHIGYLKII